MRLQQALVARVDRAPVTSGADAQGRRRDLIDFVRVEQAAGRLTLTAPPPTPLSWWLARIANAAAGDRSRCSSPCRFSSCCRRFSSSGCGSSRRTDPEICPAPDPAALLELQLIEDLDVTQPVHGLRLGEARACSAAALLTLVLVAIQFTCRQRLHARLSGARADDSLRALGVSRRQDAGCCSPAITMAGTRPTWTTSSTRSPGA